MTPGQRSTGLIGAPVTHAESICALCGIPVDARYFDSSSVVPAPGPGTERLMASFDLPPEYCGVLEYFAQFTDVHATNARAIETPDLEWTIRLNGRPLDPYLGLRWIVNPWGDWNFRIAIRLDEASRLEFVVRGVVASAEHERYRAAGPGTPAVAGNGNVTKVAGRLVGRYWYNPVYGDVAHRRS